MDKVINLNKEEFEYLNSVKDEFLRSGQIAQGPQFVIICGPVGTGKSTVIKQKYNNGYVHIDAGAIYLKLTNNMSKKVDKLEGFIQIVGSFLTVEAVENKRNIIIEIIMDKEQPIKSIIDKMVEKGYKVNVQFIDCDPTEAWKRSLNREKLNISALYTQDQTMSWFLEYLNNPKT